MTPGDWTPTSDGLPLNGTRVLACWKDEGFAVVARYRFRPAERGLNQHYWCDPEDDDNDYSMPTHWQRLEFPV
jgi:hypothetical protein